MTQFFRLEGEVAQLRQVARAYATGDISRDDYRQIRAAMIEAFVADRGGSGAVTVSMPSGPMEHSASPSVSVSMSSGESPWSLLAIIGAGAMLLFVAALAVVLS